MAERAIKMKQLLWQKQKTNGIAFFKKYKFLVTAQKPNNLKRKHAVNCFIMAIDNQSSTNLMLTYVMFT